MANSPINTDGFMLGNPALVCRWRLHARVLPLKNRHIKALSLREIDGQRISRSVVAWLKQNLEWTLESGSAEYPNGVLMLIVDDQQHAALSLGPYQALERTYTATLAQRALTAQAEALSTGVAPETLCAYTSTGLALGLCFAQPQSGVCSLISNLAHTLGMPVYHDEDLAYKLQAGPSQLRKHGLAGAQIFLVSDEHGVVEACDSSGEQAQKFVGAYERLLAVEARRAQKITG